MPVTLEQLAKVAGVSVSTISRALNNSRHAVNEETRERILTLAKQMGYHPNQVARSLKTERTHTIGIIIDDIASPFGPVITRGIQDYLKEYGYFSVLINGDWNPEVETQAVHDLISRSIDGIIFVESWTREANPTLDLANKPYVFVHRLFGGVHHNSVGVEAAVHADVTLLKQAMLHDPLVGAVCNPEEVWQMTDEMLVAQAEWLPQFAAEVPAARTRLEQAERNGTRVQTHEYQGAARLHTRTVEEMARDEAEARANADAADKGKMTK